MVATGILGFYAADIQAPVLNCRSVFLISRLNQVASQQLIHRFVYPAPGAECSMEGTSAVQNDTEDDFDK